MSARERRDAERAKLRELIAVSEAERTVADARMTGLAVCPAVRLAPAQRR